MTHDDLKQLIVAKMGEVELLDFLDISMDELVDILKDIIEERSPEFWAALRD